MSTNIKIRINRPLLRQVYFLPVDEEEEPTKESPVIGKIREIDPITMTPLEALNFLYEMKQEIIKSDEQKGD